MSIFKKILGSASLSAICYLAESALPHAQTDKQRAALQAIADTNELNEAYALAHEQLGQQDEADHLRACMARRSQSQASSPELAEMSGL